MQANGANNGSGVLTSCSEIARYLDVCERTISNWRIRHGLPVAKRPDGRLYTTKSLIDQWFLARIEAEAQVKAENNGLRPKAGQKGNQTGHSDT